MSISIQRPGIALSAALAFGSAAAALLLIVLLWRGAESAAPPPTLAIPTHGRPALWQVTHGARAYPGTAYLFGTIHILPKGIDWQTPALAQVVGEADVLYLEILGLEQPAAMAATFAKLAERPGLAPVSARIPAELRAPLSALIADTGIDAAALDNLESWAAAIRLAAASSSHLGLRQSEGVELQLIAHFAERQRPFKALETVAGQLGYFDRLPEREQRLMLARTIAEAPMAKQQYERLASAWLSGDVAAIIRVARSSLLAEPAIAQQLLIARNRDWTQQIAALLQRDQVILVAVGAGHLAGPDSVQAMLAAQGFRITRVQ